MLWLLYSRAKSNRFPLNRSLGGSPSLSGRGGEEKTSLILPGTEPRSSSTQPTHYIERVTTPTLLLYTFIAEHFLVIYTWHTSKMAEFYFESISVLTCIFVLMISRCLPHFFVTSLSQVV